MCKYTFDPLVKSPFSVVDLDNFGLMEQVTRRLCLKQKEGNRQPIVSVIMPMRDRADVVGDAIRSVLQQSYGTFELIVVDDGSVRLCQINMGILKRFRLCMMVGRSI